MPDSTQVTPVSLTINGRTVRAAPGTTLLQAARSASVDIPTLCYHPNLTANAVCRLCAVEVVGRASCSRRAPCRWPRIWSSTPRPTA